MLAAPDQHLAVLSVAQCYRADRLAAEAGVPGVLLMENAGRAVVRAIRARWAPAALRGPVAVLCGPGNNGGDGFVIARLLAEAGWPVRLALLGERSALRGDAAHHAALWQGPVEAVSAAFVKGAGLVVDALFGAGLSRPLPGPAAESLAAVAEAGIPLVAVDVPSGLRGDEGSVLGEASARAALTVTFFRRKPGHLLLPGRTLCGEVVVADIGIPEEVLQALGADTYLDRPPLWLQAWKPRRAESHKYDFGHALVVGGAMSGGARLAGTAALRVGAGVVTLAVPAAALPLYQSASPSLIVQPGCDAESLAGRLGDRRVNALLLGPGAEADEATRRAAETLLSSGRACVLDAGALTAFAEAPDRLFRAIRGNVLMTPHDGEFRRLFPDLEGSRLARARAAASRSGAVVLLKGADSVVAAPDGTAALVDNAPPQLATAGSGDVLAGFAAGLLAQGLPAFEAAAAAAWLLGEAAASAGPGMISEDLPAALPALRRLLER